MEVRDGGTLNSVLIGRYCGYTAPSTIFSTGNVMYVRFRTDASVPRVGIKGQYKLGTLKILYGVNMNWNCSFMSSCVVLVKKFVSIVVAFCGTHYTMPKLYMSRVVRKPDFCICENKDADQLRGNRKADQHLCFPYTDSTIPLLPKSKFSSLSCVVELPGLCRTWLEAPKTGFLTTRLISPLLTASSFWKSWLKYKWCLKSC